MNQDAPQVIKTAEGKQHSEFAVYDRFHKLLGIIEADGQEEAQDEADRMFKRTKIEVQAY